MKSIHRLGLLRTVFLIGVFSCLTGCLATTASRVMSPAPLYYGDRPVSRVYVYHFIDMRSEHIAEAFKIGVTQHLSQAFSQSAIPHDQLWFGDTLQGEILRSDMKSRTHYNATSVPVGATIRDNAERDMALAPTHRLIAFPHETMRHGDGVVLNVKWDLIDAQSGNLEWSVYTQTPTLHGSMPAAEAETLAKGYATAVIDELRLRKVIPVAGASKT